MTTYYITDKTDRYTDYDVRFLDLDKAIEYARWKGYSQLSAYEYDRYSHTIDIENETLSTN